MSIQSNVLTDFLWYLDAAESTEAAFEQLSIVISALGFDAISYTVIPRTLGVPERIPPVFLSSCDFSAGFLDHYQQANLAQSDFTIRRISDGCNTILDWSLEAKKDALTPEELEVIRLARYDYGIRNAITWSVEQNQDFLAGFSLTSSLSRKFFDDLLVTNQATLTLLCYHFHLFVYRRQENRSLFYRPILAQLKHNECCMLDLIAKGRRLKQSRDLYGISPTMAGNILSRLYRKFSVTDRGQLGYLIGRHQLIEMLGTVHKR